MARRRGRGGRPEDFSRGIRVEQTSVSLPSLGVVPIEGMPGAETSFLGIGGLGAPASGKGRGRGRGKGKGGGVGGGRPEFGGEEGRAVRGPRAPRAPQAAPPAQAPAFGIRNVGGYGVLVQPNVNQQKKGGKGTKAAFYGAGGAGPRRRRGR